MKILITAGPTREALDPVRYLSNRSSGKMGYALAEAAAHAGHQVLLISGPTTLEVPDGVDFLPVTSAAEMFSAVADYLPRQDAAIFAAAVADYTPVSVSPEKIKKSGETLTLELTKTADILGSARSPLGFTGKLIGFAAESEKLLQNARQKLLRKHADLIVANDISQPGTGFDSDDNEIHLLYADGRIDSPPADTKTHLARHLIKVVEKL